MYSDETELYTVTKEIERRMNEWKMGQGSDYLYERMSERKKMKTLESG